MGGAVTKMVALEGTWFVVPTAFARDGSVDEAGQRLVVEAAIEWGVDGLTVLGVMSEAPSLSDEERLSCLRVIFDAVGDRVPVAVGCSAASAARVVQNILVAARFGAVAAMVSAPPMVKNIDAVPGFFRRLVTEGGLPIVVQDEPAATGTLLPVSILLRCLEACGSTTVKLEDPPTPPKISRLLAERSDLSVFGGLGGISALSELRRGGGGTMTGFSYPEVLAEIRTAVETDRLDRAGEIFDRYFPLIAFEGQFQIGLGIRKEMLVRRGALRTNTTRGLAPLDEQTLEELDDLLARMELQPSRARLKPL